MSRKNGAEKRGSQGLCTPVKSLRGEPKKTEKIPWSELAKRAWLPQGMYVFTFPLFFVLRGMLALPARPSQPAWQHLPSSPKTIPIYSTTTATSVEQETPLLKSTRTSCLMGNWFRWSPQKLKVLVVVTLLIVTAVKVFSTPFGPLVDSSSTAMIVPVTLVGNPGLEVKLTKVVPQPANISGSAISGSNNKRMRPTYALLDVRSQRNDTSGFSAAGQTLFFAGNSTAEARALIRPGTVV
jgi:hypothetical protein